ncbi:glucosaminidase domain-containing protein [Olivibacter sp. XZL3]|uniref:glucosaminidase domain-containing protein n=1 Tax=Olivibacter sp. XZL3 TaxID=1735116 RepID=UPI001066F83A|nr:glucosaminidase domain-containing protein [Olivibacter sp. XZL3]
MKIVRFFTSAFLLLFVSQCSLAQGSAQAYIAAHKDWAIQAMENFGIPASIVLAVAMHESANGSSKVAVHLNNHFGIRGVNNNKEIRSSYKGYDSVKASYDDFITYLKTRKQFQSLFDKYSAYDYRSWAYGIMHGGYAGSKTWAAHIIAVIKKHQLFIFDNRPPDYVEPQTASANGSPMAGDQTYTVKKGDTLSAIAQKHNTSVRNIKMKNQLRNDRLKIGQLLKI